MSRLKTLAESHGSSPNKGKDPALGVDLEEQTASIGKKFQMRDETPTLPPQAEPAFRTFTADDMSAGNHNYVINRKERGLLGLFRTRDKIIATPVKIEIDPINFHSAIASTLCDYLDNALRKKSQLNDTEIRDRAAANAAILADGCCIMAYLKVRSIVISEFQDDHDESNLKRPRVTTDHVIPLPYAFAIQQLGIVHVVDLEQEIKYAPVFPAEGHKFGIPTARIWNSNDYYDAVAYARNLGMQFSIVDLKEKKGTAWWLLQPYSSEGVFELRCTLPETNFSATLALTHALFLPRDPTDVTQVVFDTTELSANTYGTLLRAPHQGINLTAFEGISGTETEVWTHA